jgi:hypothetical protein
LALAVAQLRGVDWARSAQCFTAERAREGAAALAVSAEVGVDDRGMAVAAVCAVVTVERAAALDAVTRLLFLGDGGIGTGCMLRFHVALHFCRI